MYGKKKETFSGSNTITSTKQKQNANCEFSFNLLQQDYLTVGVNVVTPFPADDSQLLISGNEPELDIQQDWNLSYAKEENGVTTLRFYRRRNTTDQQNDIAIEVTNVLNLTMVIFSVEFWFVILSMMQCKNVCADPLIFLRILFTKAVHAMQRAPWPSSVTTTYK